MTKHHVVEWKQLLEYHYLSSVGTLAICETRFQLQAKSLPRQYRIGYYRHDFVQYSDGVPYVYIR